MELNILLKENYNEKRKKEMRKDNDDMIKKKKKYSKRKITYRLKYKKHKQRYKYLINLGFLKNIRKGYEK